MVIVRLKGGLGNQMFQYAAARALSGCQPVFFDFSFLKTNTNSSDYFTARSYELSIFNKLKISKVNQTLLRLSLSENKKYILLKKVLPHSLKGLQKIDDDNYQLGLDYKQSQYLDGYFQNPKYFNHLSELLYKEFEFPKLPKKLASFHKEICSQNAVSLHIRRGDYLKLTNLKYHGVLPLSYYEKAYVYLNKLLVNPVYYVFSDDIEWCQKNLSFIENPKLVIIQDANWIEMYLMTQCKHHIVANSSFSWWGAWLGNNTEKKIIAPSNWFNVGHNQIIPDNWIRL